MRFAGYVALVFLILPAVAPAAAAGTQVTFEGFEEGIIPATFTVSTGSASGLSLVSSNQHLVHEGSYSLSWTHEDNVLRYTMDWRFDHAEFWVRQMLFAKGNACLRVALGSSVSFVTIPKSDWIRVSIDGEASTDLKLSPCSPETGILLFDSFTTYVREREAEFSLIRENEPLQVRGSMSSDGQGYVVDVNGPSPSVDPVTVPAPAPIPAFGTPGLAGETGVSFRYNESYRGPPLGHTWVPINPASPGAWQRSGTGIAVYAFGREAAYVPLAGQAYLLLA